jgi:hypothetical protein
MLVSDLDGDWFIDLPPGTELWLPTGQVGDAGLFEVKPGLGFPFSSSSDPSLEDFLNSQKDGHCSGCWRESLVPESMLKPLDGVIFVEDAARYPEFVNPDAILVSPAYVDGDINYYSPTQVDAWQPRRGLLAFSIIDVGPDLDGSEGSNLPDIKILVRDPATINLSEVGIGTGGGGGVGGLVKLVK